MPRSPSTCASTSPLDDPLDLDAAHRLPARQRRRRQPRRDRARTRCSATANAAHAVPEVRAQEGAADVPPERAGRRRRVDARGARQRRALGRGARALPPPADVARCTPRARRTTASRRSSSATARWARRSRPGSGNVVATYRVGAGVAGRVRAGTLSSALDRPPGLRGVTNPLAARGGADQEDVDDARENAPATVRTFGRAVSLEDFADLVRATGEVAKAQAVWVWDGLERAIHLTVAGQEAGLFADDDLRRIGASLDRARDPNYRLRIANFTPFPVLLRATLERRRALRLRRGRGRRARGRPRRARLRGRRPRRRRSTCSTSTASSRTSRAWSPSTSTSCSRSGRRTATGPTSTCCPTASRPRRCSRTCASSRRGPIPRRPGVVLPAELAVVEDAARDVTVVATGAGA